MLTIHVNSIPLALPDDIKIRVEYNAPYLDTEGIPADVVWHFDVPVAGNEEAFGYVNILQLRRKDAKFRAVVSLHGYPIGRGEMLVANYTATTFRVMITTKTFGLIFNGVTLNQASFASVVIGGTPHSQSQVSYHVQRVNEDAIEADYRFPMVYAPAFYGDDNDQGQPVSNKGYTRYLNHFANGGYVINSQGNNQQCFVPMPFVMPVLHNVLGTKGYTLTGSMTQHEELNKLLMMSRVSLDAFDSDYFGKVYLAEKNKVLAPGITHIPYVSETYLDASDEHNCFFNGYYTAPAAGYYTIYGRLHVYTHSLPRSDYRLRIEIYKNDVKMAEGGSRRDRTLTYYDLPSADSAETIRLYNFNSYALAVSQRLSLNAGDKVDIRVWQMNLKTGQYEPVHVLDVEMMDFWMKEYEEELRENFFTAEIETATNTNKFRNKLTLGDHVPVVPVTSTLNTLRNLFFAAIFFDDERRIVEMAFLDDILADKSSFDITPFVIVNDDEGELNQSLVLKMEYSHVETLSDVAENKLKHLTDYAYELDAQPRPIYALCAKTNSVYEFAAESTDVEGEWKYYGHHFAPYDPSGGAEESTSVSLDTGVVPLIEQDDKTYPYNSQKGISHVIANEDDEPGLQLMFWRGLHLSRPVATPGIYIENNNVVGNLSLDLNDETGPVTAFGSRWLRFLSSYELVTVRLGNVDLWMMLEMLSLIKPQASRRWLTLHGVKCLPHQFSFVINRNGDIEECEVKAIKSNAI